MQVLDLLIIGLCAFAAGIFYVDPEKFFTARYYLIIITGLGFFWASLNLAGSYDQLKSFTIELELKALLKAWVMAVLLLSVFFFMTRTGARFSRVWAGLWFSTSLIAVFIWRIGARQGLSWLRLRADRKRVIFIGRTEALEHFDSRLRATSGLDIEVVKRKVLHTNTLSEAEWRSLVEFVNDEKIEQVWLLLPLRDELFVEEALAHFILTPVEIRYIPDIFGLRLFNYAVTEIAGFPVIDLSATPMEGFNLLIKEVEDRLLAGLILALTSPILLLLAIGVKLTSRGPVLFRQQRMGWGGKNIEVLKFRSMKPHKEMPGAISQATRDDPRVTRFGAFLRKTSLDELPQFWNVLLGQMSIVGPRPHAVEHNEQYKAAVDGYMLRHRVKPGITGWAQVHGYRGETDTLEKMKKRVEYDLYYIENWSVWLDLKIILITTLKGFWHKNAY